LANFVPRREFLRRAAAMGVVMAATPILSACSEKALESAKTLAFENWTDYIDPAILTKFMSAAGISTIYSTYTSNDELSNRLILAEAARRRGRMVHSFDLIVPSDNFVKQFRDQGLIQQINAATSLKNIGNLEPEFRQEDFDPGNQYTIPWATGTTGIGYDTSVIASPPDWSVFLNESYKGKMTMLDEIRDAYAAALLYLGKDPNTTSSADVDAATQTLIKMKGVIKSFDSTNYIDGLASGELVAAEAYSGDLLQAKQRNPKLDFVLPQQGGMRWVDSLAVPTHAPHLDNALEFMDFYLRGDISAQVSNFISYDTANAAAVPLLDPSIKGDPVIFPPADVVARLHFTADLGPFEKLYSNGWKQVQSA
jgi:spermidine/putrescine-binding protein